MYIFHKPKYLTKRAQLNEKQKYYHKCQTPLQPKEQPNLNSCKKEIEIKPKLAIYNIFISNYSRKSIYNRWFKETTLLLNLFRVSKSGINRYKSVGFWANKDWDLSKNYSK